MSAVTYYVVTSAMFSSSTKHGETEPFRTQKEAVEFAVGCGLTEEDVATRHAIGEEAGRVLAKLAEIEAHEQALDEIEEEL